MGEVLTIRHSFCCVNCVYEPMKDFGKYGIIYKNGTLRIQLEPICETIFICPKCNGQHLTKYFKSEKVAKRQRRQKRENRIARLRQTFSFLVKFRVS